MNRTAFALGARSHPLWRRITLTGLAIVAFALGCAAGRTVAAPRPAHVIPADPSRGTVEPDRGRTGVPLDRDVRTVRRQSADGQDHRPAGILGGTPLPPASDPARDARAGGDGAPIVPERSPDSPARDILPGIASWYPGSRGFHGTPHVAIPGASWTGQVWGWAAVCVFPAGQARCETLPVVDCLCGGIPGRIIDLSREAVALLGLDPGRGLWRATVEVVGHRSVARRTPGLSATIRAGDAPPGVLMADRER